MTQASAALPRFSVILPTFNRAYVLWKAISSVAAQTEGRWELVVVDDGSTDCTERMLEEFSDERIRYLQLPHRGASAARNRGLDQARGEWVAYLDSDNTWSPHFLSVMAQAIANHPDAMVFHSGYQVTLWERTRGGTWTLIRREDCPGAPVSPDRLWSLQFADTNTIVHSRAAVATSGGWDERCGWLEDWDFFLRLNLEHPGRVIAVPDVLVQYRQVHGSGADGVCAEARENGDAEARGRAYLLEKWGSHPEFRAQEKLSRPAEALRRVRHGPTDGGG